MTEQEWEFLQTGETIESIETGQQFKITDSLNQNGSNFKRVRPLTESNFTKKHVYTCRFEYIFGLHQKYRIVGKEPAKQSFNRLSIIE